MLPDGQRTTRWTGAYPNDVAARVCSRGPNRPDISIGNIGFRVVESV